MVLNSELAETDAPLKPLPSVTAVNRIFHHQLNAVAVYSCSACHTEHNGGLPIAEPDNGHCLSCHGDAHVMQASFERGKTLEASSLDEMDALWNDAKVAE